MNQLIPLENLIAALSRLPTIGRRTAERMAMTLVENQKGLLPILIKALSDAQQQLTCCERCGGITQTQTNPCNLCVQPRRDAHLLCLVESPCDILKIEASGGFQGRYHVLMGKLSPIHGINEKDLRIESLLKRIESENFTEVIIALGTDVESDATASYLKEILASKKVAVSRIAFGLPAGSAIEYSDPTTLSRALFGRQKM